MVEHLGRLMVTIDDFSTAQGDGLTSKTMFAHGFPSPAAFFKAIVQFSKVPNFGIRRQCQSLVMCLVMDADKDIEADSKKTKNAMMRVRSFLQMLLKISPLATKHDINKNINVLQNYCQQHGLKHAVANMDLAFKIYYQTDWVRTNAWLRQSLHISQPPDKKMQYWPPEKTKTILREMFGMRSKVLEYEVMYTKKPTTGDMFKKQFLELVDERLEKVIMPSIEELSTFEGDNITYEWIHSEPTANCFVRAIGEYARQPNISPLIKQLHILVLPSLLVASQTMPSNRNSSVTLLLKMMFNTIGMAQKRSSRVIVKLSNSPVYNQLCLVQKEIATLPDRPGLDKKLIINNIQASLSAIADAASGAWKQKNKFMRQQLKLPRKGFEGLTY